MRLAIPLGMEVFLGIRRKLPTITKASPELRPYAERLARLVREQTYQFKIMSRKLDVKMLDRQSVQARLADAAMMMHAWACTLAKLDADLRAHAAKSNGADPEFDRDRAAAVHFFGLAELAILESFRALHENADDTMLIAAEAAMRHTATLPNADYVIPERSPSARGTGKTPRQDGIKQFPGDHAPARPEPAATASR
jgi:hypothetical protein